jgi:hypothetical protein
MNDHHPWNPLLRAVAHPLPLPVPLQGHTPVTLTHSLMTHLPSSCTCGWSHVSSSFAEERISVRVTSARDVTRSRSRQRPQQMILEAMQYCPTAPWTALMALRLGGWGTYVSKSTRSRDESVPLAVDALTGQPASTDSAPTVINNISERIAIADFCHIQQTKKRGLVHLI